MEGLWTSVEHLNPWGFAVRTLIVGVILYIAGRFIPHRAAGQYAGYDFTFFWMMGGLIASPLFDSKINFNNTLIVAVTIFITHYIISYFSVKSRTFEKLLQGKPEILILNGQVQKKTMFKALLPIKMLLAQIREVDVANIDEVNTAILETGGRVSVLKKQDTAPVTPKDLNIPVVEGGLPSILINDGKIIDQNLTSLGYDRNWLKDELHKVGVSDMNNVYLATIDGAGHIYFSLQN